MDFSVLARSVLFRFAVGGGVHALDDLHNNNRRHDDLRHVGCRICSRTADMRSTSVRKFCKQAAFQASNLAAQSTKPADGAAAPGKRGMRGRRNHHAYSLYSYAVVRVNVDTCHAVDVGSIVRAIGVAITIGPPPIPVYEQPICPGDGYLWVPGYWAYDYDIDDYYWVPGTWIVAPEVAFLWTPGYWGWGGDRFVFYDGYWGPLVGFYGGINYGFGYFGFGFEGGRWDGGHFFYNRAVLNVDVNVIHNVYNTTVV